MNREEIEAKKIKLVGQLNVVQEQINDYGLECVGLDSGYFKELCQKKQYLEQQIKYYNRLLAEL